MPLLRLLEHSTKQSYISRFDSCACLRDGLKNSALKPRQAQNGEVTLDSLPTHARRQFSVDTCRTVDHCSLQLSVVVVVYLHVSACALNVSPYSQQSSQNWRLIMSIPSQYALFKEPIIRPIKSKMAEIWHLENRHDIIFCRESSDLDKISQTSAEWHVDCGDMVETGSRIPIWRTFGRIQWHVIPEPRVTLQGAATWRIQCYDPRATLKIVLLFIFVFLMQFGLRQASPIHLLIYFEENTHRNKIQRDVETICTKN